MGARKCAWAYVTRNNSQEIVAVSHDVGNYTCLVQTRHGFRRAFEIKEYLQMEYTLQGVKYIIDLEDKSMQCRQVMVGGVLCATHPALMKYISNPSNKNKIRNIALALCFRGDNYTIATITTKTEPDVKRDNYDGSIWYDPITLEKITKVEATVPHNRGYMNMKEKLQAYGAHEKDEQIVMDDPFEERLVKEVREVFDL